MFPQGVTYCGESSASTLTMANVPWHEEVVRFVRELVALIPDYEIACEHEHSNCLLIAHKKVRYFECSFFSHSSILTLIAFFFSFLFLFPSPYNSEYLLFGYFVKTNI